MSKTRTKVNGMRRVRQQKVQVHRMRSTVDFPDKAVTKLGYLVIIDDSEMEIVRLMSPQDQDRFEQFVRAECDKHFPRVDPLIAAGLILLGELGYPVEAELADTALNELTGQRHSRKLWDKFRAQRDGEKNKQREAAR